MLGELLNNTSELVLGVIALCAALGTAVFYLKYTGTKANIDGLEKNNAFLRSERDDYESKSERLQEEADKCSAAWEQERKHLNGEAQALRGEVKTLKEVANQTPQVLKLTESITRLTDVNVQNHKQSMKMMGKIVGAVFKVNIDEDKDGK